MKTKNKNNFLVFIVAFISFVFVDVWLFHTFDMKCYIPKQSWLDILHEWYWYIFQGLVFASLVVFFKIKQEKSTK
jgi:hypothetical protein